MGLQNFIPSVWTAKLFVRLRKSLVFANVVNKDYEPEISAFGDTVYINELGPVATASYTKGTVLTYATLDSAQKSLLIDQGTSFSFSIDDIDKAQTKPKLMTSAMSEAAYSVADGIDQVIAGLYAQAGVTGSATYIGSSGASVSVSSGNAIETISYIARYLTEKNVPTQGRFGIIPPWLHQKLWLAETGSIASTGVPKISDSGILMNGWVGNLAGFDLMVSNNVSTDGTQYRCMFGTPAAISYAGQITEIEALRLQTTFADAMRGLYVYGVKVIRPNALCTAYLAEAAG